jgi:spermidine synthase
VSHPSAAEPDHNFSESRQRAWAIFLVSVLGLFLEMMLIRWISTEIRIFAYLQNTVLVVCVLGLGMGCLTSRGPFSVRRILIPLLILVLLVAVPATRFVVRAISPMLGVLEDFVIWNQAVSTQPVQSVLLLALGLVLTALVTGLIWYVFVPIGRLLGRLIDQEPRTIRAYTLNVVGSLAGIWLFVGVSAYQQSPLVWFLIVAGLLLFFLSRSPRARLVEAALIAALVVLSFPLGREAGAKAVTWSPYQKLVLRETATTGGRIGQIGQFLVEVNNTDHQEILNLSPARTSDTRYQPPEMEGLSQYDLPALIHPRPRRILIVGAGSGNDVAGALRQGAEEVTAVEIDPVILEWGRKYHPEKPYDSPRIRIVNDDARSFLATDQGRYDVISFGLLDSHTTTSMTNARLDHFVYTREGIERAKAHLADGGVIIMNFFANRPFIADRMASVVRQSFGEEPFVFIVPPTGFGRGGMFFIAGDLASVRAQIAANARLSAVLARWQRDYPVSLPYRTQVATDDWPYVYLRQPSIPTLHFLLALLVAILFVAGLRLAGVTREASRWSQPEWHFAFLGAAFLLLEVQNITKASVVLGNTWLVNAVIISAVLAMVLAANAIVSRYPAIRPLPVYLALCASSLGLYFIDIARFAFLPYPAKAILVGALTSLPMLFSGIVFIRSFASVTRKDLALGANLFGAVVGALIQPVTFLVGIKALLLVVTGFYIAAMLTRPRAGAAIEGVTGWASPPPAGGDWRLDRVSR